MLVYLLLVAFILILNQGREVGWLKKDRFFWYVGAAFILITGLRHPDVGSDTGVYFNSFYEYAEYSFDQMLELNKRDVLFYYVEWVVGRCTGSFTCMALLVAVTFYVPLMLFIRRYSKDPGLSCLVILAFSFFQFSMTGMRQTMAFGFILLYIMKLQDKKVWWKPLILLLIAVSFHKSALLGVIYFFLVRRTTTRIIKGFLFFLIPFTFMFRSQLIAVMLPYFEEKGFDFADSENGGGLTTYIVYLVLLIWVLLSPKLKKSFTELEQCVMLVIVCTQSLVMVQSVFFRGVWYFSLYLTIILPNLIESSNSSSRLLTKWALYGAMLFMYLFITMGTATVLPYKFMFQN